MTDVRVWASTAALGALLRKEDRPSADPDAGTCDWGWTSATVLEGGHTGNDGALDGTAGLRLEVDDPESQYRGMTFDAPGSAVSEGAIVSANFHGDEDDDSADGYGGDGPPRTNADGEEAAGYPDDLVTLTHLHEPAVVHCLRKRYARDAIYTNTGPILLALNPFKSCRNLYSDGVMRQYWERGEARALTGGDGGGGGGGARGGDEGDEEGRDEEGDAGGHGDEEEALSPHVYDLADATYRSMMMKIDLEGGAAGAGGGRGRKESGDGSSGCDQSIVSIFDF